MKILLYCSICFIALLGCNADEYSPNQVFNRNTATATNQKEIAALPQKPAGSTLRIAVSGDTQRSYQEAKDFVDHINSRNDIDFVFLDGDISDFGLLLEFKGIFDIYDRLRVPFISVIGNHDLVANGRLIYERMFGPLNFTFNYAGIKFVCHDTNGREYDFNGQTPNINWLKENLKLEPGISHIVAIAHVPPTDADFDPKLVASYESLFNQTPGLLAGIYAHQHSKLSIYYKDGTGVPFYITNAIVKRAYSIFEIKNGQVNAQEVNF